MSELVSTNGNSNRPLDSIKQRDVDGHEYWIAFDLMLLLGYKDCRNFGRVIDKAITSCKNNGESVDVHISGIDGDYAYYTPTILKGIHLI